MVPELREVCKSESGSSLVHACRAADRAFKDACRTNNVDPNVLQTYAESATEAWSRLGQYCTQRRFSDATNFCVKKLEFYAKMTRTICNEANLSCGTCDLCHQW